MEKGKSMDDYLPLEINSRGFFMEGDIKMNYKTWFERRPDWLIIEIEDLKEKGFNFNLDEQIKTEKRKIVFIGNIKINSEDVELELHYPSEFPTQPIWVYAKEKKLVRHQNPFEKNLCVIPQDQEGWNSNMNGSFMVQQAIRLLEDSEKGEEAVADNEVDSPEPWSTYLPFEHVPLYVPQHLPSSLLSSGNFSIAGYLGQYYYSEKIQNLIYGNHHILEQVTSQDEVWDFERIMPFQKADPSFKLRGIWFYLPIPPNFDITNPRIVMEELGKLYSETEHFLKFQSELTQYKNAEKMTKLLKSKSQKGKQNLQPLPVPTIAFVFDEENYERNQFRKAFIRGEYSFQNDRFYYSEPQYVTPDEHFRRIPELSSLIDKNIFIAGLGSLGSAVAIELGKSGIGSYTLMDKDTLEVGNLVRHTGGIEYVGIPKTKVAEEQILSHFPFAKIERVDGLIGLDAEKMEKVYKTAGKADLILNLTAEESVIRIFNRIGLELNVPVIHAWISNGAYAGIALRTIPKETGCYHCQGDNQEVELINSSSTEIYPRGCGFPTFPGASFDIYEVATQTVRLAVNTLLIKELNYDQVIIQHYPEPKIKLSKRKKDLQCLMCGVRADESK